MSGASILPPDGPARPTTAPRMGGVRARRAASLLLATLLGAPCLPALAQPELGLDSGTRRIAVFVRTRQEALRPFAARTEALVRQHLAGSRSYEPRPTHRMIDSAGLPDETRAVNEGTSLLRAGFDAYRHGKYDEAVERLGRSIELLEKGVAMLDKPGALLQAHQLLGSALLEQGKTRDAISWYRRVISLAPDVPLDSSVFSQETIEVYERTRKEALAEKSELEVTSDPPGAAVLLDGRFVDVTPARLKLDTAGHHVVRIVSDGWFPAGTPIDLQPDRTARVQRKLVPVRHQTGFFELLERAMQSVGEEELTADNPIQELGEMMEVEQLVLVRALATKDKQVVLEGFHYDFLDGRLVNVGDRLISPKTPKLEQETAQFIDDLLAARLDLSLADSLPMASEAPGSSYVAGVQVAAAPTSEEAETGGGGRRSLLASPWLWAGVGGVAAAAAGTAVVLLVSGPADEQPARPEKGRLLFGFE